MSAGLDVVAVLEQERVAGRDREGLTVGLLPVESVSVVAVFDVDVLPPFAARNNTGGACALTGEREMGALELERLGVSAVRLPL